MDGISSRYLAESLVILCVILCGILCVRWITIRNTLRLNLNRKNLSFGRAWFPAFLCLVCVLSVSISVSSISEKLMGFICNCVRENGLLTALPSLGVRLFD